MESIVQSSHIWASIIYSFLGILILVISFIVIDLLTPSNLWREITQNKNIAVAILAAAFMLSIAMIISSAIH